MSQSRTARGDVGHSLAQPFLHGAGEALVDARLWTSISALLVTGGVAAALAAAFSAMLPGVASLVETPIGYGDWAIEWRSEVTSPAAEQARQVAALSYVVALCAALTGALAWLSVAALWRQHQLRHQGERSLLPSLGARRPQLVARLMGEGAGWWLGALALAATSLVVVAIPLERTFPGSAVVRLAPTVTLGVMALCVAAMTLMEMRAAHLPSRIFARRFVPLVPTSTLTIALALAVTSTMVHLVRYAPDAGSTQRLPTIVTPAQLSDRRPEVRSEALREWERSFAMSGATIGVASAGFTRGIGLRTFVLTECGACSFGGMGAPLKAVRAELHAVSPDTFDFFGLSIEQGRGFDSLIDRGPPSVAIVNQSLARSYFERGDAVGRRLRVSSSEWLTVVGIIEDRPSPRDAQDFEVYLPILQAAPSALELLSAGGRDSGLLRETAPRRAILGRDQTPAEVFRLSRWFSGLLAVVGGVVALVMIVGVGISARSEMEAMTSEIGLRKALGARKAELIRFSLSTFMRRAVWGIAIGIWLALSIAAWLQHTPGRVPQFAPGIWTGCAALIMLVLMAGLVPDLVRSLRLPPSEAMKEDLF